MVLQRQYKRVSKYLRKCQIETEKLLPNCSQQHVTVFRIHTIIPFYVS